MELCQNVQILTYVDFVTEISNKHFCKLDEIRRNFPSCQKFVVVTVCELFDFEL